MIKLLRKISNHEIARRFDISPVATRNFRISKGISSFKKIHKWTIRQIRLLGTIPDKDFAARMKMASQSVSKKRRKLGIKSFRFRK